MKQIVQLRALPEAFWWMVGTVTVLKLGPYGWSPNVEQDLEAKPGFKFKMADPLKSANVNSCGGFESRYGHLNPGKDPKKCSS